MKRSGLFPRRTGKAGTPVALAAVLSMALASAVLTMATTAEANTFSLFGPRAQGMGGAHVAVADDFSALYWNPGGLALNPGWDIAVPLIGVRAEEHNDVIEVGVEIAEMVDDGSYLTNPIKFINLVEVYNEHGSGVAGDAQVGLALKGTFSGNDRMNFAVSLIDYLYIDSDPRAVFPFVNPNNIELSAFALESREFAFSFAYALLNEVGEGEKRKYFLSAGVNLKYIWGVSYFMQRNVLEAVADGFLDKDATDFINELIGENRETTHNFGIDVGLLFEYNEFLRFGLVGRNLNNPKFDYVENGVKRGELELEPHLRFGVAVIPIENIIVSADVDLTKNSSGIRGFDDQRWALGAEFSLFEQLLSLRVGVTDNFAESLADPVMTAGVGFRIWKIHFDLSGGMNPDFDEATVGFLLSGQL